MKRILSFLLALVMVLSMVPVSMLTAQEVSAEQTSILGTSPSDHTHNGEWIAWGDDPGETSLPTESGKYYIAVDNYAPTTADLRGADAASAKTVDITICLNGKTVTAPTGGRLYTQNDECRITFCDCTATVDADGKLQATNKLVPSNSSGGLVQFWPRENKASYVIMENVVVDGAGVTNTNGGMVYRNENSKGELHMENCVIKNCDVTGSGVGGVIWSRYGGGTVKANNVEFLNNSAAGGGGVAYFGDGSTSASVNYAFTNCHFEGNESKAGGGVFYAKCGGTLAVTDSTFKGNKILNTSGYGGAAIVTAYGGVKLQLTGCDFTENVSSYQGGVIAISNGNAANSITDCTFTNNSAAHLGGVILLTSNALTVTNSTFTGNSTTGSGKNGSVIYAHSSSNTVTLNDCTITGNTASGLGAVSAAGTVNVTGNTKIYGNTASDPKSADLYLTGTNKVTLGNMGAQAKINVGTNGEKAYADFLAWASSATPAEKTGITYTTGEAAKEIIYNTTDNTFGAKVSPSVHTHAGWTKWDGTSPITASGKYYLDADTTPASSVITAADLEITLCLNGKSLSAASGSRLFYIDNNVKVTVCDCQAELDEDGKPTSQNQINPSNLGGSIATFKAAASNSQLIMDRVIMDGTTMSAYANGNHCLLSWNANAKFELTNCVIRDFAGGSSDAGGNVTSTYPGGAVSLVTGGSLTATKVWFENNNTVSKPNTGAGAIYAPAGSAITLTDCTFNGNTDTNGAGAVAMVGGSLTATNVVFSKNKSPNGAVTAKNAAIQLTGGSFEENESSKNGGGALRVEGGSVKATEVAFKKNKSTNLASGSYGGGAVLAYKGATKLTFTDCSFEENSAYQGGAVAINNGNNENSFVNCTFKKNSVSDAGAVALLWHEGYKTSFTGCTFEENTASRGSVLFSNQLITLDSCVVKNNAATGIGAIHTTKDVTVTGNTQFTGNTANPASTGDVYLNGTNKLVLGALDAAVKFNVATKTTTDDPNTFLAWADAAAAVSTGDVKVYYTNTDPAKTIAYTKEDNKFYFVTGEEHDQYHTGWVAWDGVSPLENGKKYYLTGDVAASNSLADTTVTVCLNGHSMTPKSSDTRLFEIYQGSHVTICDCKATFDTEGNLTSQNKLVPSTGATYSGLFTLRTANGVTNKAKSLTLENVVIDGTGITATKANGGSVIAVWNHLSQITMKNCVVKNCAANETGAISMTAATTLKAENVLFSGNSGKVGGAIYSSAASTIELVDTRFENNTATTRGGAIDLTGDSLTAANVEFYANTSPCGAVTAKNAAIQLTGGSFEENESSKSGGGALRVEGGSVKATDVVFKKNKSTNLASGSYGGGAVLVPSSATRLTFTGCSFEENSAYQGGAIAINNGNNENSFVNCTFKKNTASDAGGAALLWHAGYTTGFTGCTFEKNTAARGSVIFANQAITLEDSVVKNNAATGVGAINTSGNVTVIGNTQITDNSAADPKRADLYLNSSNKLILGELDTTAKINVSTATAFSDPDDFMQKAAGLTLAETQDTRVVYGNKGKTVSYKDSKGFYFYSDLPAHEHYACACAIGATGCDHGTDPQIEWEPWGDDPGEAASLPTEAGNYYLTQNVDLTRDAGSGVTYIVNADVKLCMNGFDILCDQNNTLAAAYRVNNGKLTIMNCKTKLDADKKLDTAKTAGGKISGATGNVAGALQVSGSSAELNLIGVIVADNNVPDAKYSNQGGALLVSGGKVNVNYCRFQDNSSKRLGGAILLDAYVANPAQLTVENTVFVGNETPSYGGAIGVYVGKDTGRSFEVKLNNCLFEGNKSWEGGAIFIEREKASSKNVEAKVVATGCTFNENTSTENGGAIYVKNLSAGKTIVELKDCTVTGQSGKQGGAIYGDNATLILTGGRFQGNKATAGGGAITAKGGSITAKGTVFKANEITNTSGYGGAAILIPEGGTLLEFTDCAFEENKSAYQAGAIAVSNGNDKNSFTGCTFKKNTAPDAGGALLLWHTGRKITFNNCTFEENTAARGSAIFANQDVILNDCTIKNNTATGTAAGAVNTSADLTVSGNTVIYSNIASSAAEKADVLLSSSNKMIVGQLGDKAKIGVATGTRKKDITDPDEILAVLEGVKLKDAETTGILFSNYLPAKQVGYSNDKNVQFYFTDVTVGEHKDHGACACAITGDKCSHEEVEWEPWPYNDRLPTMGGNYYLTADVDLTQEKNKGRAFTVTGDVNLCMNGKNIKCDENNVIGYAYFVNGGKLTIMNCYTKLDANNKLDLTTSIGGKISGATGSVAGALRTGGKAELNLIGVNVADNEIPKRKYSNQGGAGLLVGGGTVHVNYCRFENNVTDRIGGAIMVDTYIAEPPVLTVENTSFVGNVSDAYGGAIGVYVGVKTGKSFEMTVKNCLFEGNRAYEGGAICIEGEYSTPKTVQVTLNVEGCKFAANTATNNGGGICIKGHGARQTYLNLKDSTFTEHKAKQGGALHVLFTQVNGDGVIMEKGMVPAGGGAFYANKSDVKFANSEFNENDNPKSRSAAVSVNDQCTLEMTNCRFYKNIGHPKGDGGALRLERSTEAVLNNCVFEANHAQSGGAVSILRDCVLTLNGCTLKNNTSDTYGGAVASTTWQPKEGETFQQPTLIINNSTFTGNSTRWNGGAVRMLNGKIVMNSGTFSGNIATEGAGGAIAIEATKNTAKRAEFYLKNGSIVNNQSANAGGIFVGIEADFHQTGGYIAYNRAENPNNENGSGGGTYLHSNARAFIYGGTYEENWCQSRGGAIQIADAKMYLYNATIQNNHSDYYGGGIANYSGYLLIEGGLIDSNVAALGGGGLFVRGDTDMKGGKITNNKIVPRENWMQGSFYSQDALRGGGIMMADEQFSVYYQRFVDLNISGGEISGNYAPMEGGGIYMNGRHTVTMTGGVIKDNISGGQGGGVMIDNHPTHMRASKSIFRLIDGEISGNSAVDGGGIYSQYCAYPDLQGGIIQGNTASGTGGGLYLGRGTNAQLRNVLITENKAAKGAAMYFMDDTVMENLHITANEAGDGYSVYLEQGDYDGESYVLGIIKMSGDMFVAENKGTKPDMFIGKGSQIIVGNDGMGKNTRMNIDLEEGVLTSTVLGAYDYEGGNLHYTLTAGDRSVTDVEVYVPAAEQPKTPDETTVPTDGTVEQGVSLGIGGVIAISAVLIVAVIAVLAVVAAKKKKKAEPAAEEPVQE